MPIRPEDLLDVITGYVAAGSEQHVTVHALTIDQQDVVVVTERERVVREPLHVLAQRLSMTASDTTRAGVAHAFARWVSARPVTDEAAAAHGIATLGWAASHRPDALAVSSATGTHALRWRVVVPRPWGPAVEWLPLLSTRREHIDAVRNRALRRAAELTVTPVLAGNVVVWTCALDPALSSSVLHQPGRLHEHLSPLGVDDLFVVTAPGRPVAVADVAAASRLSEESRDVHVLAAYGALADLTWGVGRR